MRPDKPKLRFSAKFFLFLFLQVMVTSPASARFLGCGFWFSKPSAIASDVLPIVAQNKFITDRNLWDYVSAFFHGFHESLMRLRENETWIDLGAGKGKAIEEYVQAQEKTGKRAANTVVITYKLGRLFKMKTYGGKIKILENRLFEDIPDSEIPTAKLMTDFFGILSYTKNLTLSLQKIFSHMEVGGELYLFSDTKQTAIEIGKNVVSFTSFLKTIPGIRVEGDSGVLRITKLASTVQVPMLKLISIDEKTETFFRRFVKE